MVEDPFAVLGVPRGASEDEVRRAFRRQARRLHPDAGGDADAFVAVERAYRAARRLSGRRRRADRLSRARREPAAPPATSPCVEDAAPSPTPHEVIVPAAVDHRTRVLAAARLGFVTAAPTSTRCVAERTTVEPTPLRSFADELARALSTVPDRPVSRR